jgi:hypothetical protein
MTRPQKITFGEMRESDVRGLLICADYHCTRRCDEIWRKKSHFKQLSLARRAILCERAPFLHGHQPSALVTRITEACR